MLRAWSATVAFSRRSSLTPTRQVIQIPIGPQRNPLASASNLRNGCRQIKLKAEKRRIRQPRDYTAATAAVSCPPLNWSLLLQHCMVLGITNVLSRSSRIACGVRLSQTASRYSPNRVALSSGRTNQSLEVIRFLRQVFLYTRYTQ